MKKIIALIFAVVCMALLLTACGSKQLNMKEADYIVLINEEVNTSVKITDIQTVKKITDNINSLSLKKGESVRVPPGWSHQLVWYNANDKIIGVIGVLDDSTLGYNDYYYSVSDGSIDIDFFDELLDSEQ
jgi:uncharacterized protein YcfL